MDYINKKVMAYGDETLILLLNNYRKSIHLENEVKLENFKARIYLLSYISVIQSYIKFITLNEIHSVILLSSSNSLLINDLSLKEYVKDEEDEENPKMYISLYFAQFALEICKKENLNVFKEEYQECYIKEKNRLYK